MSRKDGVKIIKTTTWSPGPGCHGGCGVLVHVKDNKVIKVEGDPDHPWNQGRLCSRCLSMTQYMYHPDRLKTPLKRVGKKGEGKFAPISWDEAFDLIEEKMKKIREDHGPESVIFHQGTGRDIGGWISMLAYAYGSPNWMFGLSGISCYTPRLMMMSITQGDFAVVDASQWHEKRYDDPKYKIPETVTIWGQNLPATCPDGFFGHWYVDLMKRGTQLMVIDPRCTWIASRAKLWLQLRPGTDAALALGFIHVILKENLWDKSFVEKWTNAPFLVMEKDAGPLLLRESHIRAGGSDENFVVHDAASGDFVVWDSNDQSYKKPDTAPSLTGAFSVTLADGSAAAVKTVWTRYQENAAAYTPEKVSEITWVPADKIVQGARMYAKSAPSALHWGLPIDTIPSTIPTSQAINHLWCMTGNLDVPGGNAIARYACDVVTYPYHSGGAILSLPEEVAKKRIGMNDYGPIKDFRAWAQPDKVLEQIFSGDPYAIKGMWIQTANPIACTGMEPGKWRDAIKKLDFTVCVDLFMTPTAMLCDVILPAASFLEKDSLKAWWVPLQAIKKTVDVGECKSDIEINLELSKRFMKDFPYESVHDLFDSLLASSGMTYKDLQEKTWIMPPDGHPSKPYSRHEKGLLRPDGKPGFRTPSGKVELYSSWLEKWELAPMPYHEEPPYSPVSTPDLFKKYPLILCTGRRMGPFFHSEHRQIPWLREQQKEPVLEIHPDTAEKLGIHNGEKVCVENWLGKITVTAMTTPIIHPDVVMAEHGWWFPEKQGAEPSLFGVWDVNVNQLIPMSNEGKGGLGAPIKSMLCRVYKAKG
ncbi:molybdopterin-dependent oxidoreductase [Desulfotignum phosphitoxidans]|uniref:Putative nitrate reductase subunit n=1 Tax=Desulfotignum phosphitoxidans DSM 13687 TaxID=1286635 RepID=S0G1V8_9BACT|nr:molybdopterin-dependent oxidoreductase [Desulfotignum phosphitoxidans]EMS78147.1 putative nitrate reductase subunit [Desulfotignum phosphitoxidans DSM 13687]